MKKICCVFLALSLLMLFHICPSAAADGYLVKVMPKVSLFSRSDKVEARWITASSDAELARIQEQYEVLHVEPDYDVKLFYEPTDQYISHRWDIDITNIQSAWNVGCSGGGVRIGVIDSGVYLHSDIKNNVLSGYNFVDDNYNTSDTNGHGTGVSGIIAAEANKYGVIGMAYSSKIIPLKCFGDGSATKTSTIIKAIYSAADEFDCDVINMSLGVPYSTTTNLALKEAIDYVVAKGIIVVAAAGNDGNNTLYYPAAFDSVTGVGAISQDKSVPYYSQRNDSVSVAAPGDAVLTLDNSEQYYFMSGTSAAAPFVTALAAIAKNLDPSITSQDFKRLIEETAVDAGDEGYDTDYGYGIVNATPFIKRLLTNKDIFVSPENIQDNSSYVYITNCTDSAFHGKLYSAIFSSPDRLSEITVQSVLQAKNTTHKYVLPSSDKSLVQRFLWGKNMNVVYSYQLK